MLLFVFMFCVWQNIKAQQLNVETSYIGKYYWTEITTITACNIDGTDVPGSVIDNTETTIIDQYFNVIKIIPHGGDEYAIIKILNYNPLTQRANFLNYNFEGDSVAYKRFVKKGIIANDEQRYFKMNVKVLTKMLAAFFTQIKMI